MPSSTPPVVEAPTSQTNIGVPNDYRPPRLGSIFGVQDVPGQRPWSESVMGQAVGSVRYQPGDEFGPLNNPESVVQLQAQLANLGFLNPDNIRPGVWDSTSASAYRKVLAIANQYGISAQEAIKMLAANPTLGDLQGGGSGRKPLSIELSNPLDIAAAAQGVAQKMLGRNLSEADLKPIIDLVQRTEAGEQRKSYEMGGKGGTRVAAPSGDALLEDYYKKNFGDEAYGYAAVERMNEFYGLLNSPVQGAP